MSGVSLRTNCYDTLQSVTAKVGQKSPDRATDYFSTYLPRDTMHANSVRATAILSVHPSIRLSVTRPRLVQESNVFILVKDSDI